MSVALRRFVPPGRDPAEATFFAMADWIAAGRGLDPAARQAAKRAVLDAAVAMLTGLTTPEGKALMQHAAGTRGRCRVPGTAVATTAGEAALVGAALAQVHDGNDGHAGAAPRGPAYHPGRVVVPTALAMAQHGGLSGPAFLSAVAVGYDIALSVRDATVGAPPDAYGAAVGSAQALGLGREATAFALRVAGFNAPTSDPADFETNNLTVGQQARCGVEAATLVGLGYPVSGAKSFHCPEFGFQAPARHGATLEQLYFKPFTACRKTHPYVEAMLALRPGLVGRIDGIAEIRLFVGRGGCGPAHRLGPGAGFKSYQFCIAYCAVAALLDGDLGPAQFRPERTADARLHGLQERCTYYEDDSGPGDRVEIVLADGSVLAHAVADVRGSSSNPLSEAEIADKLVRWAGGSIAGAGRLLGAVEALDEVDGVDGLLAAMRQAAPAPSAASAAWSSSPLL